jgi:hypothetical protein
LIGQAKEVNQRKSDEPVKFLNPENMPAPGGLLWGIIFIGAVTASGSDRTHPERVSHHPQDGPIHFIDRQRLGYGLEIGSANAAFQSVQAA